MKAVRRAGAIAALVRAGLTTAVVDGAFSSVLAVAFYHSTVPRLFRGVASVVLGKQALDGGTAATLFGVFLHFCTAFFWSGIFLGLAEISPGLRRTLGRPFGVLKVASVYAPFEWSVMSLAVIPLLVHRPPSIDVRWWVQFVGQIFFVGIPIVGSIARRLEF